MHDQAYWTNLLRSLEADYRAAARDYETHAEFAKVQAELAWDYGDRTGDFGSAGYRSRRKQADDANREAERCKAKVMEIERQMRTAKAELAECERQAAARPVTQLPAQTAPPPAAPKGTPTPAPAAPGGPLAVNIRSAEAWLADILRLKGPGRWDAGRPLDAFGELKKAILHYPRNPDLLLLRAEIVSLVHHSARLPANEVRAAMIAAEEVMPNDAEAWRRLAEAYMRLDDRTGALKATRRVLTLNPVDAETLLDCLRMLFRQQATEETVALVREYANGAVRQPVLTWLYALEGGGSLPELAALLRALPELVASDDRLRRLYRNIRTQSTILRW